MRFQGFPNTKITLYTWWQLRTAPIFISNYFGKLFWTMGYNSQTKMKFAHLAGTMGGLLTLQK